MISYRDKEALLRTACAKEDAHALRGGERLQLGLTDVVGRHHRAVVAGRVARRLVKVDRAPVRETQAGADGVRREQFALRCNTRHPFSKHVPPVPCPQPPW